MSSTQRAAQAECKTERYKYAQKNHAIFSTIFGRASHRVCLDSIAHQFAARKAHEIREMYAGMGVVTRAIFLLSQGFIRTAMYMFYIVVLILSRVAILRPGFIPVELASFFHSLEYGIILLIVFDKLKELLKTDQQWFRLEPLEGEKEEPSNH